MAPKVAVAPAPTAPSTPGATWGWKQRASHFFCLLIIFGFPIFSVPCQKGACTSPLEVVATYGYVKNLVSAEVTKAVLYPATLMMNMEVLMGDEPQTFQLPAWDGVLSTWNLSASLIEDEKAADQFSFSFIPNFLTMFEAHNPQGLSWEFVGACAVCLIGGFVSIAGPNKISFWGILLVLWFIYIDGGKRKDVFAQPMLALAVICALGWVNFKEIFSFPERQERIVTDAKSSVEAKKKE